MKAAAVAIGVNRTGGLTPLSGAVPGAERFAQWAAAQGMDVQILTDANDKVRLAGVLDVIQPIVESKTYDKLIVYFAGHGYLLAPQSELWLLSEAPTRPSEAINVQLSRDGARYCGIPHVIFVSDACRSGGANHRHRSVSGGSAFPVPDSFDHDGEVDTFYATRPGDPALEFKDDRAATANYKGVFTDCLLAALKGKEPTVVKEATEGGVTRWLVPSRPLKPHLRKAVPEKAADISIKLKQDPEVRVESALPRFFGELKASPASSAYPPRTGRPPSTDGMPSEPDVRRIVEEAQEEAMSFSDAPAIALDATSNRGRRFIGQVERITLAQGRESFETMCGFTIYGKVGSVTLGSGLASDLWLEGEVAHVRIQAPYQHVGTSILIEFEDGSGTVLAVKPEFIGTVLLDEDRVVNVNYTPARSSDLFHEEYDDAKERIERRRAFAAAAAREGVFDVSGPDAAHAGDYLRMMKRMDPTLGIYAAYAYHEAGRIRELRDVLHHMREDPPPVPFDVALLARESEWPEVAPFCPMLSQGWALLALDRRTQRLAALRPTLIPALWTTLTPEGVDRVREMLTNGEVQ